MPQFDKITFFNQIFWLLTLFLTFYLVLLKNFLPKISAVLKVRTKKLLKGNSLSEGSSLEINEVHNASNQEITKLSSVYRQSLVKDFETSNGWVTLKQKNLDNVRKIHEFFLVRFGEIATKKFIVLKK